MEIETIPVPKEAADLREVAICLQRYLRMRGAQNQSFEVLRYLADQTIQRLNEGKDARFSNLAIQIGVVGQTKKDPSTWFSPIWKRLTLESLPSWETGLIEFAKKEGLNHYPWVNRQESAGGAGNQALYYLEARVIPLAMQAQDADAELSHEDISYIEVANLKPSWWAKWLFAHDYSASGWRKALYIATPLTSFVILGLFGLLLFLVLSQAKSLVSSQELMLFVLLAWTIWYAKRVLQNFMRIADDRIAMASDSMVGFSEFGVCLELSKPAGADKDSSRNLRLVKYAAECPVCSAGVLLDAGEPDFPRRIVGRCKESPREHVFSFDRVKKRGYRLR